MLLNIWKFCEKIGSKDTICASVTIEDVAYIFHSYNAIMKLFTEHRQPTRKESTTKSCIFGNLAKVIIELVLHKVQILVISLATRWRRRSITL